MKFSDNGYYVEKYLKCANCGMLVYGPGLKRGSAARASSIAATGAWSGPPNALPTTAIST